MERFGQKLIKLRTVGFGEHVKQFRIFKWENLER